ncbi:MAG TPA: DUF433 domain-containing protein [Planctomycetota bacterium]|nr:DUF433 domain-containing protein [Planctomycetota bacterium]
MADSPRTRLDAIYRDPSFVDRPLYPVTDAARALRLPQSTVDWWVRGRDHYRPVVELADPADRLLSFRNLCEVWVLQSLRRKHRVSLPSIRQAIDEIRERTGYEHPLVQQELLTDGRSVLYERFGDLIDASRGGQGVFEVARPFLDRVEWDADQLARLFPVATSDLQHDARRIVIDPRRAFGHPCLFSNGTPVEVFLPRFHAGESISALAEEFGCTPDEVQDAIRFQTGQSLAA